MRVYKYWAVAKTETPDHYSFLQWRGSNESQQHAEQLANDAVQKLAVRPRSQLHESDADSQYLYQTRHVPEELISVFPATDGSMLAAVTRNRYGALVLNTADMVIIDADISFPSPAAPKGSSGMLSWLFGQKVDSTSQVDPQQVAIEQRLQQIRRVALHYSQHKFRIYRTHSGFRIVLLDVRLLPNDPLTLELLEQFQADSSYRHLCRIQQSFRARLTPKPANIPMDYPPARFPFTAGSKDLAEKWEHEYEARSQSFRVCELVADIGSANVNSEVEFLLNLHDQSCRVNTALPLA